MTTFYYPPSPTVVPSPGGATEATLAAFSAKVNDNYGAASGAVRSASQIGNTTGAADFGAGATSAQTIRTVIVTDQTAIPVTTAPNVTDFGVTTNAQRVASVLGTATGALSATNPAISQLSDGASTYTAVKTTQAPATLGQKAMAASFAVAIASDQTAIPVTTTPGTLDFGASAAAGRVAALIGNASGANTAANPVLAELSDGSAAYTAVKTAQIPTTLGQKTMTNSLGVTIASDQTAVPASQSGTWSVRNQDGAGTALTSTLIGPKQSLDVNVANTVAIPVTATPSALDFGVSSAAGRVAAQIGNASGANSATNPVLTQLTDGTTAYTGTKTAQLPTALGQTTMAASVSVAIASNQSAVPVTFTPATVDFGVTTAAQRVAALIGIGTTAAGQTNPVPARLGDGTDYIDATAIAASQKTISTATKTLETVTFNLGWDGTTHRELACDTSGFLKTVASGAAGRTYADSVRLDYSSTNVTTGAWVQLIASTAAAATQINLFSGTSECLELGTGAAASETRILLIPPGGFDNPIDITIASAARVSVRAVSATASTGSLVLNLRS